MGFSVTSTCPDCFECGLKNQGVCWASHNKEFCSVTCLHVYVNRTEPTELFTHKYPNGCFSLNRTIWDIIFQPLYDTYDYPKEDLFGHKDEENEIYAIMPYSWDDDCACDELGVPDDHFTVHEQEQDHHTDCPISRPNFTHRASGLKVWWYKYPFRQASANMELTRSRLEEIIKACTTERIRLKVLKGKQ